MRLKIDKRQVAASFSRAAQSYDAVALLQREVGHGLLQMLSSRVLAPESILDLGCGTGYFGERIFENFDQANLIGLDISMGMLRQSHKKNCFQYLISADAERLPFADESFDCIFSNLVLQWCDDLPKVFQELHRVLRPKGFIFCSSFASETLKELRNAWKKVDDYSHVNDFYSLDSYLDALNKSRFCELTVSSSHKILSYPSVDALMLELKGLGARNLTSDRPRALMGKASMEKMRESYLESMVDNTVCASFEIVMGYARRD